ncbi:MAG: 4-hydroxy-3-methylbut-2-enyl diphosphate reductase [Proteobacteria bacterium]|nr:4-hydroxy-3-methylbut-2-enyl diphosphate reductase [Pseudomonadota bacterium]
MTVYLANPRGFCAGVERAIDIVEAALEKFGAPIYVRHEVVHNRFVVDSLKARGAVFVDELSDIPDGSTVIFSAHGVSQQVREEAASRNFTVVLDATCPLVTKVHMEVARQSKKGHECILIGHAGHAEVEGTLGQYKNPEGGIYLVEDLEDVENLTVKDPENLCFVTQTTLSVDETIRIIDALKKKFEHIKGPRRDDICYATQNRQDAVKILAQKCNVVLVVGSVNSSNSNRLRELSENLGTPAYLLDKPEQIDWQWFKGAKAIGITAGASAPDILVKQVIKTLEDNLPVCEIKEVTGIEENMSFSMPKELREVKIVNYFKEPTSP